MWIALTRVGLPVMEEREVWKDIMAPVATGETAYKEPGDQITKAELKELGWSDEKISDDMAHLTKGKSVGDEAAYAKSLKDEQARQEARDTRVAAAIEQTLRDLEEEEEQARQKEGRS